MGEGPGDAYTFKLVLTTYINKSAKAANLFFSRKPILCRNAWIYGANFSYTVT